ISEMHRHLNNSLCEHENPGLEASTDTFTGRGYHDRKNIAKTPFEPVGSHGQSYLDLHSKESRIHFRSDHQLDNGTNLATYLEMDFLLAGHGDERVSNSYNPRLRHAFLTYDKWLFGQTWTTLFNVGALPENLDFIGPSEATIFGRQVMIRYSNGPWRWITISRYPEWR
ncbi:MAG: hypothetical protein V3R56_07050, partial [Xanthomonadales bacterium]